VRAGRIHRLIKEQAATFGTIAETVRLDWTALMRRQQELIASLRPSPQDVTKTAALFMGEVKFLDPHAIPVDGDRVAAEHIVIAAGWEPVIPPIEGRENAITSDQLLFLPEFPQSLVMVGAGVTGLEMAGAFTDLGAQVTIIGKDEEILPTLDSDVAAYIRGMMEQKGVTFVLNVNVTRISGQRGNVTVHATQGGRAVEVNASEVCLSVGRRFNPKSLGTDAIGLEHAGTGLKVSPSLQTSIPHIYAAGDASGGFMLTPVAAYEGKLAARNALRGESTPADYSIVPQTIFTTPEVGRVGLTHKEALKRGVKCHVSTHDLKGASNGRAIGEDGGYLKLIFDGETERLLGVQMVSFAAAELMHLCALAIKIGATADQISMLIAIHPSHAERLLKIASHDYHEICEVE
jgi:pyruvate/2-oxoglutarate dehydrogenase complex dihydrolipoamide dehydrogenase (E3) component